MQSNSRGITVKHAGSPTLDKLQLGPKMVVPANKRSIEALTKCTSKDKLKKSLKAISWLIETAFRGLAGYIILIDKRPTWLIIAALTTGIYMTTTSIGLTAYHFIKAHDK